MKRRLKDFTVKLFSLILAITMCIPTNVYALADDGEEEMPTIMRLDEDSETDQTEETSDSEDLPTISEEDRNNYDISYDAKLSDSFDSIIYTIKISKKEESIHDPEKKMTLALSINKNQSLTDLHIDEVRDLEEGEVDYSVDNEEVGDLHTFAITTPTSKTGVEYTIKAPIAKDAIDTEKLYSLDMSVDIGDVNIDLRRISYKFMEEASEDNPEEVRLVLTKIKESDDAFQKIAYNKSDEEGKADTLVYTDYLISKDKQDEASISEKRNEVSYKLILDENQDPATGKIALDYFKANDKGFVLQKEFSTEIAYQEDLTLDVPAGYLLKLTYTNQTDKTKTKVENYSVNNRAVKNPRFVKEEEKAKDEEEDPAPAEKEEKSVEDDSNKEDKQTKENESKDTNTDKKEEKKEDKKEEPSKKEEEKAKDVTNLEKADAELKKALADPKNTIKEIQALLDTFEKKYNLSTKDQEKLMTDNDAAIKALVEKDRKENFRPNVLATTPSYSFADKKFNLKAKISVKANDTQPIPKGHYFDVQVGPYLMKDANVPIKDLTYNGKTIATCEYKEDGDNHYIRYTYVEEVTKNMDLDIDQILAFDTDNIGYASSVNIDIKVAPQNNPVQSMPRKTVRIYDQSPVDSSYDIIDQGETKSGTYPYQLNWRTKSQILKDNQGNEITRLIDLDRTKLEDAYVEWDIEVDTDKLVDPTNQLTFDNLNLTVFGSANQGLKNISYSIATEDGVIDEAPDNSTSNLGEIFSGKSSIEKEKLGKKLYIKVRGYINPNQVHETYNIGFRINPDENYINNLLKEFKYQFDRLPTPIKWLKGVEYAQRFAEVPFNLVETNIPATFFGLDDKFTNEKFYYDNTRTIVADRKSDSRADWYALDLLRRGETQDPALDNPTFDINNGKNKQTIEPSKVYFVPLKDGGYRKTTQVQDAILANGQYYPGTIVSYEYVNESGKRADTYNFRTSLKEKKKYNVDEIYDKEGGSVNLFTEKISNSDLVNGYLAYIESPYPVMRINKNFDMVSCFNDRINAPIYDGKDGVFLDIHEDVSGDYLITRLNESNDRPSYDYRLVAYLNGDSYDGVSLNHYDELNEGQAMEELMKKIYFYGEEVKKEYSKENDNEEMHRMIEASMYQRVIHHFTDGKALTEDYFDAPSDHNIDEWKVDHTLQGIRQAYPKTGWDDSFAGKDTSRRINENPGAPRKLKDNETRIKDYPPVQSTQYEMAKRLYNKVIKSYKEGNDWNEDKADSVKLVFYSHTDEGKYQELIAGRVVAPIEIDKYKKDGKTKLKDATFKLTNINTGESKEWISTDSKNAHKLYLRPGKYRVQEIKTPTGYEKIQDFEIEVKREEIYPDNGPYDAKKLPRIHVNDGYKTSVVLGNNIPTAADGTKLVKLDENQIKVSVTNIEDNLGKLEFVKRNKFTKLNGAEFRLRKINAKDLTEAKSKLNNLQDSDYDSKYNKTSKGSYGEFKFEQIPAGFYVLEETIVPGGYEKAPLYLIEAKAPTDAKKKVEVRFVDENIKTEKVTRDGKEINLPIIMNETKVTDITFRKVRTEHLDTTKEHLGLGDAKFRLMSLDLIDGDFYLKEGFTDHSTPTKEGKDKVDGQQAYGGGYITFDGLKAGEYLLEELQAPKGYNKTSIYGWKLVVKELKELTEDDKKAGKKKGELSYKLYEVKTDKDLNSTDLKEVNLDEIIYDKDKKIKAFQIGNDARKINVPFKKYKGEIIENEDGTTKIEATADISQLKGKNGQPVSFDLYKSDFYGAIIGDKDASGNIIPYKKGITQDANGNFNLEGLEFGGYYILRETNPPAGYDKAADITLKVEAEAIADEGKMKVIVRDPNTNAQTDLHSVFQGVIDFKEEEKLGEFSIKKVGNAIGQKDENGNPIKVGLRRAYFRLYTANDKYEIEYKDKAKKYPKEYIQKVTPGVPITKPDGKGGQTGKTSKEIEQEAPNQGIVTFDQLKPGKYVLEEYRGPAGYERDPNYWYILVEKDGTVHKYRDNPKNTTDPRTVDGNLIEIFNKDETGFRIPLRISKVNENKAALTGSQFKARKLINGEKVKLYEKNDDGTYTDTGKVGYPKYHDEKFDGVSEATGKPGDNYFRELTPGIYELTEIKTPNDSYRLPKDKDGKDMKWYFKVVINKDKVPSDAGYMDITFDFEHTFSKDDDFNSAITEEEKKALIGKTIKGFTREDPDFARYIEEVKDDGRSDPARPDAPYKWIHDARVTNYKNKTSLGFMKKDSETHRNISGAVFSLRKAKLDADGNLVFENNKPAYAPEKTTGKDGKPLTEAELNLQRVQPYNKEKQFATAVSNEKLGVEFTNIDEGTYILEEIKPAKGYKKTDSFIAIKFTEGDDGSWKQEVKAYAKDENGVYQVMPEPNDFVGKDDAGGFVSVKNDKAYTKLKFQKIEGNKDSDGNEVPVESADFRLTQVDKDDNKIPDGYEKSKYSYGGSSIFEFTNIPVGRYKLEETRSITKFEKPDPWFFNVVQDPETHKLRIEFEKDSDGNLDESIGFDTENGKPKLDEDGNLQNIKIRNYSKTSFSFMKYKNETEDGKKLPLKDAYFRLTKVRYSMDKNAKTYEYYSEDNDAVLKKYTNGKKVTEYNPDGSIDKYTYDGDVISSDDEENYKPDAISQATGKYSSLRRSQTDGSVDFQNLGEGIYQLEEVGIPDGYQSGKDQTKWIFEVKKTDNGLKVVHNVDTEKTYFENYDKTYYNDFYNDYYKKVYTDKTEKPNIESDDKDSKHPYSITNTKATTDLKWEKINSVVKKNIDSVDEQNVDSEIEKNVIEKYTKFVLVKTSDNPADIDSDNKKTVENAISGQSKYPPYQVESDKGIFEIKDLSKGVYNLIETDAPEGYKKATRKIAIKVYEDKDSAIKKQFYEIENGKLIKEVKDFNTLLKIDGLEEVDTDTDKDGNEVFYFMNTSKPYHFNLSKGFMDKGQFKHITKGKLKVKIYADPADDTNTDETVYEQTIDLSDAKSYRINLNSNIQKGKDYILEEVKSPDGYVKTKNKYRLRFSVDANQQFVATLVAVLDENGKPLKNSYNQNVTETGTVIGSNYKIKDTTDGSNFQIVNNKTEIEFTKVGKDGEIETPLEGVEFYLEKQDPYDIHKENQGYYPLTENMEMIKPETDPDGKASYYYINRDTGKKVTETRWLQLAVTPENSRGTYTSKDQGKFKITDLTDGYYRIIEPNAPTDYMQVLGAVKKFKVDQGKVYVFEQDNTTGQEVAKEVTDENIGSLGKIINEKRGKGKFELNKTNDKDQALDDVTFELFNSEGIKVKEYTTNDEGKITFEGLPYGTYWLRETKTKDGYIVDRRARQIRLGKDWNVPTEPSKPKDVTESIIFDGYQKPLKSIGSQTSSYNVVYPNQQEAILAYFKFKIKDNADVKAGDTFTLKFSDNVDLYGIFVDNEGKGNTDDAAFNIYSDAGLVAKAKVNDNKRSITYTFTEYLNNYNISNMRLSLQLYADRYKIPFSQNITVTAEVGNTYTDGIYVDYRGNTSGQSHTGYQDPRVDVSSYMLRLNPETKTFTTIVYVNQWNKATFNKYLTFSTDKDVEITSMKKYIKLGNGSHTNGYYQGDLPDSYGVELSDTSKYKYDGKDFKKLNNRQYRMFIGAKNPNTGYYANAYVVEIKGKITDKDAKSLRTNSYLYANKTGDRWYASYDNPFREYDNTYTYGYWTNKYWEIGNFETWSQFYQPEGTSEGTPEEGEPLSLNLVNFKNRIEFMKVDGGVKANVVETSVTNAESLKNTSPGSALANAEFKLQVKNGLLDSWSDVEGSTKTSNDKGFFSWKGLAPGDYKVIETKTPDDDIYDLPTEPVATFTVDDYGNIVDVVPDDLILENYKKAEIKIKKTDKDGKPLEGADFLLKPEKDPSNPDKNITAITRTTDKDGLATFNKLLAGKYTLTEEKAPAGYKKSNQKWQIKVTKDGKVKWLNSFDDTNDKMNTITNPSYVGYNGTNITSEVIGVNATNKLFRQKFTIKAKPSDIKGKAITIESLANDIKLTDANTRIRLVASDGTNISDKDNTSYKVAYDNKANPKLTVTIDSQIAEDQEEEKEKNYILLVDMPYKEATKVGAKITYNGEPVSRYLTSFASGEGTLDMSTYKGKYLDRDINMLELLISNEKAEYPFTGGPGTWQGFTIVGAILMSLAAIYLALKKKHQLNQANPTT